MARSSVKRSLLAFFVAVIVAIACMLVLAVQVPSVVAAHAHSNDFKRSGIGEVVDEDADEDEEDEEWDFMDDDAILGLSERHNAGLGLTLRPPKRSAWPLCPRSAWTTTTVTARTAATSPTRRRAPTCC